MSDPTHPQPDPLRRAMSDGAVIELHGATIVVPHRPDAPIELRMTAWRARSLAEVLQDWTVIAQAIQHPPHAPVDQLDLSKLLGLAADVATDGAHAPDPLRRGPALPDSVPSPARLAALAILGEREPRLSVTQRIAVIDAASWWLKEPFTGPQLAHALLESVCTDPLTAQHTYLALITEPDQDLPPEPS